MTLADLKHSDAYEWWKTKPDPRKKPKPPPPPPPQEQLSLF